MRNNLIHVINPLYEREKIIGGCVDSVFNKNGYMLQMKIESESPSSKIEVLLFRRGGFGKVLRAYLATMDLYKRLILIFRRKEVENE